MLVVALHFIACDQTSSEASAESLDDVLARAYHSAGGLDQYYALKQVSYTKRSVLYLQIGSVESDVEQRHHYSLQPSLSGDIQWTADSSTHLIRYADGEADKLVNDNVLTAEAGSAKNAFLSAYYVLFIPFKLADPGVILTLEGVDTLESGLVVDVVKAAYEPAEHENHSTSDTWWYYFDHKSGRNVGAMVHHPPTYALIENIEMTDDHGLRFNTYRRSYRCDASRNKEFLRAEFWYSDYEVHK